MKKLVLLTSLLIFTAAIFIFACTPRRIRENPNHFQLDDDTDAWYCNNMCNKIYDCGLEELAVGKWATFDDCVIFCDNAGGLESTVGACLDECDDNADCSIYDACARPCLTATS
jgi:hypothetical protein